MAILILGRESDLCAEWMRHAGFTVTERFSVQAVLEELQNNEYSHLIIGDEVHDYPNNRRAKNIPIMIKTLCQENGHTGIKVCLFTSGFWYFPENTDYEGAGIKVITLSDMDALQQLLNFVKE